MNTEVYQDILKELSPYGARLIAVSKTRSVEDIQELYDLGQRDFGENRIKELNDKAILLPQDIRWHLIGPLQSKKVKLYTSNIHLFHALDRKKIWNKLNSWAENENTVVSALLQIHIARESSKSGFDDHEIRSLLSDGIHEDLPGVRIRGL
ncbi:MAG: YggS family pyridoxal phosphate-dependent enzyme, partial [Saprospiraceae bacterium]|nr:YggS family pyridoxal phosphate-dependent enzyme [Saprospiraceae bacterium]